MTNVTHSELLAYVENMPAFPKSVKRIMQLASDYNASAKDIVQVIECDPVMTVKILQVINSPYYGFAQKISSIPRAVVHIGINSVKNIALSVAAIGILKPRNQAGFNTQDFLLHSLTTAIIGKMIGEHQNLTPAECSDCYIAGLLHDFGKLVFAECLPDQFKESLLLSREKNQPLYQSEREIIGINHAQTGQLLAEKWEFSPALAGAIAQHHSESTNDNLAATVMTADVISNALCRGDDFENSVLEPFSGLADLIQSLGDLTSIKAEALSLMRP